MRVNLSCGNVGVPQERLHDAQVRAICQKMARESVPQNMRTHLSMIDTGRTCERLQFARDMLARHMAARTERRKQPAYITGFRLCEQFQIIAHRLARGFAEGDEPLLVALATDGDRFALAARRGSR